MSQQPDGRVLRVLEGHPERWIKGAYREESGGGNPTCWCLAGIMSDQYGNQSSKDGGEVYHLVLCAINLSYLKGCRQAGSIEAWNDRNNTTFEDVLAVVKETGI